MIKLPREFYDRQTILVAKELLGCYLVHCVNQEQRIGKIVEVEAYLGQHDLASHSSKGLTKRTALMYGPPGFAYVYLIYGMYHCFNVVTETEGKGAAVLIRAIEPIANLVNRTNGPGLLCQAMGIDKSINGHDLLSADLFIAEINAERLNHEIVESPRVGVAYAKEWAAMPLRFYLKGNSFVSKRRPNRQFR